MTYFDDYLTRINAYGGSAGNALKQSTADFVRKAFANSPSFTVVQVNGVDTDVRVVRRDKSNEKTLLFLPGVVVDKGSYVTYANAQWLLTDFDTNDVYPKATIKLCNETLKWKDKDNNIFEYPCVVASPTAFGIDEDIVATLSGNYRVAVQYNSNTETITEDMRFIFGKKVYKVTGIDAVSEVVSGVGVLNLFVQVDGIRTYDDFANKIADNSHIYSKGTGQDQGGGGNRQLW